MLSVINLLLQAKRKHNYSRNTYFIFCWSCLGYYSVCYNSVNPDNCCPTNNNCCGRTCIMNVVWLVTHVHWYLVQKLLAMATAHRKFEKHMEMFITNTFQKDFFLYLYDFWLIIFILISNYVVPYFSIEKP